MLDYIKTLGGKLLRSVDLNTGEVLFFSADNSSTQNNKVASVDNGGVRGGVARNGREEYRKPQDARAADDTLSTCHISPRIEWRIGGGVLKVIRNKHDKEQEGAGKAKDDKKRVKHEKRGKTGVYSAGSRRRLMQFINSIIRTFLPVFITLTYPDNYPVDAKIFKRDLDNFIKRLRRKFPKIGGVWKLEIQLRGAPHYHLLVWGVPEIDLRDFVPTAWYEVVGSGDWLHLRWHEGLLGHGNKHCVSQAESYKQVNVYVTKYISKKVDTSGAELEWGRWWGVFGKENLPLAPVGVVSIPQKLANDIMRYQRRFARIRSRDYPALTIICDADQWIARLLGSNTERGETLPTKLSSHLANPCKAAPRSASRLSRIMERGDIRLSRFTERGDIRHWRLTAHGGSSLWLMLA
jgi:hypothetical protein